MTEITTTVWIVEDNDLFRDSLADALNDADGVACPLAFSNAEEAIDALGAGHVPNVILLDIGLPGISGIEALQKIHALSPETRAIMLTVHEDDDQVFEALCAGASGYLVKPASVDRVVSAVREIRRGGAPMSARIAKKVLDMFTKLTAPRADYGLTDREREVLELLVDGRTQRGIAERLYVSEHTINTHIRNIYSKLHVHSRSGAVAKAVRERLV